jgi:lipoate---protein ligase
MTGPAGSDRLGWQLTETRGEAGRFHARPVPDVPPRTLWIHRVDRPAVVLGSTQPDDVVDRAAAARLGIEVARRRSGGGLVLVHPDHSRWVDVVIPRTDPCWSDDVGHAFVWLGRAWGDALRTVLPADQAATVHHHEGALLTTRWSRLLCFAGLGPGEVTVGGAKVVGISQRRTRRWARFQCLVLTRADPDLVAGVVSPAALPDRADQLWSLPIGHPLDLDATLVAFVATLRDGKRSAR